MATKTTDPLGLRKPKLPALEKPLATDDTQNPKRISKRCPICEASFGVDKWDDDGSELAKRWNAEADAHIFCGPECVRANKIIEATSALTAALQAKRP